MAKKRVVRRRKKTTPKSIGLTPAETGSATDERERRASRLLAIDDEVGRVVQKLKGRGFTSPYLRPFVVARINPIRFSTSTEFDVDQVLDKMHRSAAKFNVDKIRQQDIVRAGGAAEEE